MSMKILEEECGKMQERREYYIFKFIPTYDHREKDYIRAQIK